MTRGTRALDHGHSLVRTAGASDVSTSKPEGGNGCVIPRSRRRAIASFPTAVHNRIFGGTAAVSDADVAAIQTILGGS